MLAEKRRDYTVHARVRQLQAAHRVLLPLPHPHSRSRIGRFRTAPPRNSDQPVRIGFFSCQAWQAGYFNAHSGLAAEEDLDLVICLGDYIYENATYPGARTDDTGTNNDGDCQTFPEYRDKYRLYQSDPQLQGDARQPRLRLDLGRPRGRGQLRRRQGLLRQPSRRHDQRRRGRAASRSPQRQRNGYQAFFEAMPRIQRKGDPNRIYGKAELGRMADLYLLDQRQYRDQQPCGDAFFTPAHRRRRATTSAAPDRLAQAAPRRHRVSWKVLGNQLMLMAFDIAPGVPSSGLVGGLPGRARGADRPHRRPRVDNVVALTGDIHTFFAGTVTTTGRVTGPPPRPSSSAARSPRSASRRRSAPSPSRTSRPPSAPSIRTSIFADFDRRGYGVLTLDNDQAVCEFKAPSTRSRGALRSARWPSSASRPGPRSSMGWVMAAPPARVRLSSPSL